MIKGETYKELVSDFTYKDIIVDFSNYLNRIDPGKCQSDFFPLKTVCLSQLFGEHKIWLSWDLHELKKSDLTS
jgi:hypothetical protein